MHYNPCVVVVDGTTADTKPTVAFVRDIVSGMEEVRNLYRNLVAKPEGKKTTFMTKEWTGVHCCGRHSAGAVSVLRTE